MERLKEKIDSSIQSKNYGGIHEVFSAQPDSWNSIGQGEQRSLAAHFVKCAVSHPNFLPAAFGDEQMMKIMIDALGHLPSTVEGAADSKLRQMIFDYKVNEDSEFSEAARILSGTRMEDDPESVYYTSAATKCDVYVKIAECFLEDDEIVESDSAVTKAGSVIEGIKDPEQHVTLILRFKSTYARVLDANRKFLSAASRYHELSQSSDDVIRAEDLLTMLGKAATTAILAPSGPQRHRVLGYIYNDSRLSELDTIENLETHSTILKKMYKQQIIGKAELTKFESTLQAHQKAVMGDGLTILERSVVEHNMIAVSKVYDSIRFTDLGRILAVGTDKAEKIAANMIMDGSLRGSIDQVAGFLEFEDPNTEQANWDKSLFNFCSELNQLTESIQTM